VAHEQNGAALPGHVTHLTQALLLKSRIAHRQHLVDDQDFWLQMGGDREPQLEPHAARVVLDRRVNETLDLGEGHDFVELRQDFAATHAQNGAVEEDVLAPRQLRVKTRPHLEQ
jgi:hypothetical protein